jgi:hypothetical protein
MQLLAAPGLPNSLYLDELLTATVQMAKYQLQYNVLSMHDAHYRRLYRPSIAQGEHIMDAFILHQLHQQLHEQLQDSRLLKQMGES